MNTEKKEDLSEKINPQAEEIADLSVTDEQGELARGGQSSTVGSARIRPHHHVTIQ